MREERRLREEEERAEELKNAPSADRHPRPAARRLRLPAHLGYAPGSEDIYVSVSQVRKASLRKGDVVTGKVRRPRDNEKYLALLDVETVNGMDPRVGDSRRTSTSSPRSSPTSGSGSNRGRRAWPSGSST